jgi:hypothetical protein
MLCNATKEERIRSERNLRIRWWGFSTKLLVTMIDSNHSIPSCSLSSIIDITTVGVSVDNWDFKSLKSKEQVQGRETKTNAKDIPDDSFEIEER